jgi:hypothetical protein
VRSNASPGVSQLRIGNDGCGLLGEDDPAKKE